MKNTVQLVTLLLCVHSAAALQCWSCWGEPCSPQTSVTCSSTETMCVSSAVSDFSSFWNSSSFRLSKGCASSDECPSIGVHYFSVKLDSRHRRQNNTCCNSDNCNAATASLLAPPAGSLQCYSCDPQFYSCKADLSCDSGQSCFHSRVSLGNISRSIHGCVSENMCNTHNSLLFSTSAPVSCCNTPHCNIPGSSLQCMHCYDPTCSSQSPFICSEASYRCITALTAYINGSLPSKGCVPPEYCHGFYSYNIGDGHYVSNYSCCDTDLCNAPKPTMTVPPAGSLQCYGCDTYGNNTVNVTCNTQETCVKATYSSGRRVCGCISKNLCYTSHPLHQGFFYNSSMSCCDTPFCNHSGHTTSVQRGLTVALLLLQLCVYTVHF